MHQPAFGAAPLRQIRCVGMAELGGFRLKLITIAAAGEAHPELVSAAKLVAGRHLRERPTRHEHHGVGFLGVHDGKGSNQVFLDLWINSNELTHTV